MTEKSLSVIIPNYNGRKLLEAYLPYTMAALEQVAKWELIVVDDASTDDSIAFLQHTYPQVLIIKNKINKGFSFTCNAGMAEARYNYLFFLNSDIKLTPEYFSNQWNVFEDKNTFGVMGKILEMDSGNVEVAAKYPKKVGDKFKISSQFYFQGAGEYAPTAFLSGANALVDAEKMKYLGGFDEIYSPFYFEDLDLSTRAWRMGWKCYYDHVSICYHLGSCTIKQENLKKGIKEIYFRNRLIFHGVHLSEDNFLSFKNQTLWLEVIPKMILGKFWIYKSYKSFLQYDEKIQNSRSILRRQMNDYNSKISLFDILDEMDNMMERENVIWM
ncbi:glycosyltransferase family 2 protein [Anditalea andensis]|uniref:Glycosyl transferase n=1 Tax=Anditalea andensis TaxID=1048983 RepID=A0A074KYX2_9BACT|nr:glycosyltransferase [Anditalea andensis]KEO72828.1 glycosyl transferase [Anditalea andensis]